MTYGAYVYYTVCMPIYTNETLEFSRIHGPHQPGVLYNEALYKRAVDIENKDLFTILYLNLSAQTSLDTSRMAHAG